MRPALCALLRAASQRQVTTQRRGSEPYKQEKGAAGGAQHAGEHLPSEPAVTLSTERALASREGDGTDAPSGTPQWLGEVGTAWREHDEATLRKTGHARLSREGESPWKRAMLAARVRAPLS